MTKIPFNSIEAMLSGKFNPPEKNYPEQVYDYPETVVEILKVFYDEWNLPSGAIPTKRQKGKFNLWSSELVRVEDICGTLEIAREAYRRAKLRYDSTDRQFRPIVWKPLSLEKYLIDAVSEIKRETEDLKMEYIKKSSEIAPKEEIDKAIDEMENMFGEED